MSDGPRGHRTRPVQWRPDRKATDPARLAAYDILRAVDTEGAYANLVAAARARRCRAARPRRRVRHDPGLRHAAPPRASSTPSSRPAARGRCSEIDPQVLDVVRLGAMQILFLRTPPHAAVGETVQLARLVGGEARSKFANAVLRRVGERDLDDVDRAGRAGRRTTDPAGHLAVVQSHPRWIVDALHDALSSWTGSPSWAETEDLLAADNEPGSVTLVARPGRCDVEDLLELSGATPGRWSPYAVALDSGNPGAIAAVRSGDAGVQDEGSQLVALALSARRVDGPDDQLARHGGRARGQGGAARRSRPGPRRAPARRRPGARTAPDSSRRRCAAPRATTSRSPPTGPTARGRPGTFDRVLLDAPCTGLGVLRRRPESRWRRVAGRRRRPRGAAAPAARGRDRRGPGRAASSATSPARRTSPRPTSSSTPRCAGGGVEQLDAPTAAARGRRPRRRSERAAVAARARHRRDVPRGAAPHVLTRAAVAVGRGATGPAGRRDSLRAMGVQISPSILSADFARLAEECERVAGAADWLHVDVMDNHFVPNLTLGLPVVEALLRTVTTPVDCHLMIEDPDRWAPAYAEAGAGSVTFHVEAAAAPVRAGPRHPRGRGPRGHGPQAGHPGRRLRRPAPRDRHAARS